MLVVLLELLVLMAVPRSVIKLLVLVKLVLSSEARSVPLELELLDALLVPDSRLMSEEDRVTLLLTPDVVRLVAVSEVLPRVALVRLLLVRLPLLIVVVPV